jgi:glycerol uptake facilitator-like aquaporin
MLGGVAGAALLKALTPESLGDKLGYNFVNPKITAGQGLVVELVATFVLVLVVFAVTDEFRMEIKGAASLAIGLTVVLGHIFSINYTNCGMNPARVFGPAVMANYWDNHWIYWIGECVGGILAAILYVALFSADESGLYNRLFKSICGSATISNGDNHKENIPVSTVSVERITP